MPLGANAKLGPYEIKSLLGAGGMGEVYRARDIRLNRDVAIKVLRGDGSATAELRSRFEREARAVAAMSHPNIIAVYDFGIEGGQQYIASEFIEGESLRSLLKGKPLPGRRLVEIAAQVADGLAAAHAAGVVHRDLKPENIMLTKDGRAKVLDFGLARHVPSALPADPGSDETFIPATRNLTSEGAVLGTASYMSPEQALGQETDYRSDQFSLGLILYELASGKQAFAKPSGIETMAAIVRDEPQPIEEKLPPPLKWIIDRCLQKEPGQRYESTRDLSRELANLRNHFSEVFSAGEAVLPAVTRPARQRSWLRPVLYACSLLLVALLVWVFKPAGQDIAKYQYTPFATDARSPVWSPDGGAVAYSAVVDGVYQVFLRHLNSPVPVQLTHEKHDAVPQGWSSDRNHIILLETTDRSAPPLNKILSVATVGGDPEPVMDSDCLAGCDLSPDGQAWAELSRSPDGSYTVFVSQPLGSPLKPYSPAPFASKELFNVPQLIFSPDGKNILLFRTGDENKDQGWLLPFPAGSGSPKQILGNMHALQIPTFAWMPDNRHLVASLASNLNAPTHLWTVDTQSAQRAPLTIGTMNETTPRVSPDGNSIVYGQLSHEFDVVSVSLQDGSVKTILSTGREETMAAWSAKQEKLAWVTNRSGPYEIWTRMLDGWVRPAVTAADFPAGTNKWFFSPALSPDAERVVYCRTDQAGTARLWISSLSGGSPVRLTNAETSGEAGGSWSPDGSRIAYLSETAGRTSLMIARASGNAAPVAIRSGGPSAHDLEQGAPEWSPTGEWITYRDLKGWYLVSPDGKRSIALGPVPSDYLAFSRDGRLLYGIQTVVSEASQRRVVLFSLDPFTRKQTVIKELGSDFQPSTTWTFGIRFSVSPDGRSMLYSTGKFRHDLWMLTGYQQPGLRGQLRRLFSKQQ